MDQEQKIDPNQEVEPKAEVGPEAVDEQNEDEPEELEIVINTGPPPKKLTLLDRFAQPPIRYLVFAIAILVLIIYTVPLLFFITFSSISFFYYIYPAALLGATIFIFYKTAKVKPKLGAEIATILVSIAAILFSIVYLLISFSFVGHL